tara:strand:+ start:488 stop:1279 length:792 start_codon:yes stop_codon:yes gene_type:complete
MCDTNIEKFIIIDKQGLQSSPIFLFEKLDSTQSYLIEKHGSMPPFSSVWAKEQTSGHGRRLRPWHQVVGKDLAFSLSFDYPDFEQAPFLPQIFSFTLREFIEEKLGVTLSLKWPNDLLHGDKKVAGLILSQVNSIINAQNRVIIGIGINVNSTQTERLDIDRKTMSLSEISNKTLDLEAFLVGFLNFLNTLVYRISKNPKVIIPNLLESFNMLEGRQVQIQETFESELIEYEIVGVEEKGGLIVRVPGSGILKLLSTIERIEF